MTLLNKTVVFETVVPVQVVGEVISEGENGILVRIESIANTDPHTWKASTRGGHVPGVRVVEQEAENLPTDVGSEPFKLTDDPDKITKLTGPRSVHSPGGGIETVSAEPTASEGDGSPES